MKEEGVRALYKGATPVMLRAFPANAVSIIYLFWILVIPVSKAPVVKMGNAHSQV